MKSKCLQCLIYLFIAYTGFAQNPFIRLTEPSSEEVTVDESRQFIVGSTDPSCQLKINQTDVKVYPTGAFAFEVNLTSGINSYTIEAFSGKKKKIQKTIRFILKTSVPEKAVVGNVIASIQTFPEGDLILRAGDAVNIKVKALSGSKLTLNDGTLLYELPETLCKGIKGIYQGTYVVSQKDSFIKKPFRVQMIAPDGSLVEKESKSVFSVLAYTGPEVVVTNSRLSHLEYGLGDDRLGGAKIGYLDTMIPLKVIGKVGSDYKIALAPSRTAYIGEQYVTPQPKGCFAPQSLTDKIRVYSEEGKEYVRLALFQKLPYQSFQQLDPSRIIVDVFGATSNTNWISFPDTLKEISHVQYEQIADGIFRLIISLKHKQHWGHRIFYDGNSLMIQIRPQPAKLSLDALTIAIDAGHGGSNSGAGGPTGSSEKELALLLSMELKEQLQKEGTRVMMTREKEMFVDNKERILMYRDNTPDLLISFHLNSSSDPIRVSGTSVFYRYEGFKPFGNAIYKRLLETGLKEYGNNGAFNFMLNGPTEYPNALIETLFLSNPEEEMKILDPSFRKLLVAKVVQGIKDFLEGCK